MSKRLQWADKVWNRQGYVLQNEQSLLADLKSCSNTRNLEKGKHIHAKMMESGGYPSTQVANALLNMYAKCGSMVDAHQVFCNIAHPSVVSWNALLLGYAGSGQGHTALDLFSRMKSEGCAPDHITHLAALKACTSLAMKQDSSGKCLELGKQLHSEIRYNSSLYVQNALIDMYTKCGSMADAHSVFDRIEHPTVVSWTSLILGYADSGDELFALELFWRMKSQGCAPNSITFVAALKACASLALKLDGGLRGGCLDWGRQIHSEIGCHLDLYVQNTLIDMYAKCGSMSEAREVFDRIEQPSVVSWTALLSGYADSGEGVTALDLFLKMKSRGYAPNARTYVAALKACASLATKQGGLELGKEVHLEVACHSSLYVQNALIDMYSKCGSMDDAHQVFANMLHPDVVSWTTLMSGYIENGKSRIALDIFTRMKFQGCAPNSVTYVTAFKACASVAQNQDRTAQAECLAWGKQLHSEIGCHLSLYVQTSLIDMYAKCGSMVDAHQVFDSIRHPDVVSWSALLLGYADNGKGLIALDLFSRMKSKGCAPNSFTYVAVLKACSVVGALEVGRKVHAEISVFDAILVTCLVDFYAKCGSLVEAQQVFDLHSKTRDLETWNALLAGYSSFGKTSCVFGLFEKMQDGGFQPDGVTFQCILMCCSHAGLVEKARECFGAMLGKYGVCPSIENYNCMVDVLGRANKLDDALVLLQRMPCSPDVVTWMTVLAACRKWRSAEIGSLAFRALLSLNERNAAAYELMSHIYASRGMWEEQAMVLGMRKAWETPGPVAHKLLNEEILENG